MPEELDLQRQQQNAKVNKSLGLPADFEPSINTPSPYNPIPVGYGIKEQVVGNPLTGPNPGLKKKAEFNGEVPVIDNTDFINAQRDKLSQTVDKVQDPYKQMQPYTFNGGHDGANFERYYSHSKASQLGFNPYRNNEELYNKHATFGDELSRAAGQWGGLVWTGFKSGLTSWGDILSGEPMAPDLKSAREMNKAMAIGSSSQEGSGFFVNTFLNSGYSIGIGLEMLGEELALMAATAITASAAAPTTVPGMVATGTRGGMRIWDAWKTGNKALESYRNLSKVSELKTFWNSNKLGKTISATGRVINPFSHTMGLMKGVGHTGEVSKIVKYTNTFGEFARDFRDIKGAVTEAKLEGGLVQIDATEKLIDQYKESHEGKEPTGKDLEDIHQLAKSEAYRTAYWNMPVILWSNKIMYESVFKRLEPKSVKPLDTIIDESGAATVFNKKTGYTVYESSLLNKVKLTGKALISPRKYGKFVSGYFKGNIAEGLQENIQESISGAAIDHALSTYGSKDRGSYETFMGQLFSNAEKQISFQGLETFASGFLMGAITQPVMSAPTWAGSTLWNNTVNRGDYKAYKDQRFKQLQQTADYLNKMHSDVKSYFAPDMKHAVSQGQIAEDMYEAVQFGDFRGAKDAQDAARFDATYIALRTGNYENLLEKFTDFKNMAPEELAEAFGLDKKDGDKAHQMLDSFIERAEKIKTRFDYVNKNLSNPYNPSRYKKGSKEYESMEYAHLGFEEMKRSLIFGWSTWDRNNQRIEDMVTKLSTDGPLKGVDAVEITKMMDPSSLRQEIAILKQEMETLSIIGTPDEKKILADKKEKMDLLMAYEEAMSNSEFAFDKEVYESTKTRLEEQGFKVSDSDVRRDQFGNYIPGTLVHDTSKGLEDESATAEVVDSDSINYMLSNGEVVPRERIQPITVNYLQEQFQVDATGNARTAYSNYLKYLAGKSNSFIFNEKLEESFQLMLDFRAKNKENVNLVKYINYLNDPRAMLETAARVTNAARRQHEERAKLIREGIHATVKKFEFNRAIKALYEDGWFVEESDLTAMVAALQTGKKEMPVPQAFIKTDTSETYKIGTPEYESALAIWNKHLPAIEEGFKENIEEQETETQEEVTEEETTTEAAPELLIVDPVEMTYDQYPEELKTRLEPAFETWVATNEFTPEEVTDELKENWLTSQTASGIINKWNNEQRAKSPKLSPVFEPQLITYNLPAGVTFESMSLEEVEKLYKNLVALQKKSATKERASDIQQVTKYLNDRKGRALRTPSTKEQSAALNKIKALQAEIGNKTIEGKAYIINGQAYERTTTVVGKLMTDVYGYTRTEFSKGETGQVLLNLAKEFIDKKGTAEDFINDLKSKAVNDVVFGLFNTRKLDLMLGQLKKSGFTLENVASSLDELAFEHTTIRGNQVDNHIREFFEKGELGPKPAYFTDEAYKELGSILRKIRNKLTADGYVVQATDFTVWDQNAGVAGTLDLLLIDKKGNYIIYDIKTGSTSKWEGYEDPKGKLPHSVSMMENTLQLSIYKNILQNQSGIPVKGLAILPISTTEDLDGNVTSVSMPRKDDAGNPVSIKLNYDSSVERVVPITADVKPAPVEEPIVKEAVEVKQVQEVAKNRIKYLTGYLKSLRDNIKNQDLLIRTTEDNLAADQQELDASIERVVELRTFLERGSAKELKGKKRAIKAEIKTIQNRINVLEQNLENLNTERQRVTLQRQRLDMLLNVTIDAYDEALAGKVSKAETMKDYLQDRLTKIKEDLGFRAMLLEEEIETIQSRIVTLRQALVNLGMADELIDLHLSGNLELELKSRIAKINKLVQEDHGYAAEREMLLTLQRRLTKTKDNTFTKQFSWLTSNLIKNYQRLSKTQLNHIQLLEDQVPSEKIKDMYFVLSEAQQAMENMELTPVKPAPVKPAPTQAKPESAPVNKAAEPVVEPKGKPQFEKYVGNKYYAPSSGKTYTITSAESDYVVSTDQDGNVVEWKGKQLEATISSNRLLLDNSDDQKVADAKPVMTFTNDQPEKILEGKKVLTIAPMDTKPGLYVINRKDSTGKVEATEIEVSLVFMGASMINNEGVEPEVWINGNAVELLKQNGINSVYDNGNQVTIISSTDYAKAQGYESWDEFKKDNGQLEEYIKGTEAYSIYAVKPRPKAKATSQTQANQSTVDIDKLRSDAINEAKQENKWWSIAGLFDPETANTMTWPTKKFLIDDILSGAFDKQLSTLRPANLKKGDVIVDQAGNEFTVVYYEPGYSPQFSSDDNVTFPGEEEHLQTLDSNGKTSYFERKDFAGLRKKEKVGIQIATDRSPKAKAKLKKLGFTEAMVDVMTEEDFQEAMTYTSVEDSVELLAKYAKANQLEIVSLQQAKEMIETAQSLEDLNNVEDKLIELLSLGQLESTEGISELIESRRQEMLINPVASSLKKGTRVLVNGVQFRVTNDPSKGTTVNLKQVAGTETMKIPLEDTSFVIDSIVDPTLNPEPVTKEVDKEALESIKQTVAAANELTDQEFDEDAAAGKAKYSKGGALKGFKKKKC
jgi:hypothetical protein